MAFDSLWQKVLSQIVTVPFVKRPLQDNRNPSYYTMRGCTHVSIPVGGSDDSGVDNNEEQFLSGWFMEPNGYDGDEDNVAETDKPTPKEDQVSLPAGATVILYLHGNAETISQHHRRELYKIFQRSGFYVLAFDYRGYGESSRGLRLSQTTLVSDAQTAFDWLLTRCADRCPNIIVHGHSLGSGIASKFVSNLATKEPRPRGYILESPFNCMRDEVAAFRLLSSAAAYFVDVDRLLADADLEFDSQANLSSAAALEPVLILHAEDDAIVPHRLGVKLYDACRASGVPSVRLVSFDAAKRLGHSDIYRDPGLPEILQEFVKHCLEKDSDT